MLMNLFKFKGGVKPPTNKAQSVGLPIAQAPLPSRLVVPLHQSIGGTPRPVVQAIPFDTTGFVLHPVQVKGVDEVVRQARPGKAEFAVPALTVAVFVEPATASWPES